MFSTESKDLHQKRLKGISRRIVSSLMFRFVDGLWSSDFQLDTGEAELRCMSTFACGFYYKPDKFFRIFLRHYENILKNFLEFQGFIFSF